MSEVVPPYEHMNQTELMELVRQHKTYVLKRSVPKERLIEILTTDSAPTPEEVSDTTQTRARLQVFIEKHWGVLGSQLPCKGENRGRCTIYPCPEGRHLDCYIAAKPHMAVHDL